MDNNKIKKIIFIIIIVGLVIGGFVIFITNSIKNNKTQVNQNSKKECEEILGGGFNLVFNTNGGDKIDNIHVCIACSPDSYQDIPTPTKEGNLFLGWYLDKELTKELNATNTLDIIPVPKKDDNGCQTGYEDVVLYAKWIETNNDNEKCEGIVGQGFYLEFNSNGGNKIDNLYVCTSCSPDANKDIPTPIKENSTFLGWYLDSEFKTRLNATNTGMVAGEINSEFEYDENGCPTKEKNVVLYAKWG